MVTAMLIGLVPAMASNMLTSDITEGDINPEFLEGSETMVTVAFEADGYGELIGETTAKVPIGGSLTAEQIPSPVADQGGISWESIFWYWVSPQIQGRFNTEDLPYLVITENVTFTARFHMVSRSTRITLLWNDGREGADNIYRILHTDHGKIMYGTILPNPRREGFTFTGWATDAAGNNMFDLYVGLQTRVRYLYAQWEPVANELEPGPEAEPEPEPEPEPQRPPSAGGGSNFGGSSSGVVPGLVTPDVEVEEEEVPFAELRYDGIHHAFMIGFKDGTVRPMAEVTRAQLATMLFRLMSEQQRERYWSGDNPFADVLQISWFNNAVSTATNAGFIVGVSDNTFMPNRAVTRAELATTIVRYMGVMPNVESAQFNDIAGHWAERYINVAAYNGWLVGEGLEIDGAFEPNWTITRAEAAAVISRALGRVPHSSEALLPGMRTWSDNANPNAWYYLYIQGATNSHYYVKNVDDNDKTWVGLLAVERLWEFLERLESRPEDIVDTEA